MPIAKLIIGLIAGVLIVAPYELQAEANHFDHQHSTLTEVLDRYVDDDGLVDYPALLQDKTLLDDYLTQLSRVTIQEVTLWSESQQLAFWINAYNALTLDTVIAYYPLKRRGLRGFAFQALVFGKSRMCGI